MDNDKTRYERGIYTEGRIRAECIMLGHEYLKTNDPNNHVHLRIETDRYYDSLPEDSEAKQSLTKKWDLLSKWYDTHLKEWTKAYASADSMDKHDLRDQKKVIRYMYEKERFIQAELNYHFYKTYWDRQEHDYSLD